MSTLKLSFDAAGVVDQRFASVPVGLVAEIHEISGLARIISIRAVAHGRARTTAGAILDHLPGQQRGVAEKVNS